MNLKNIFAVLTVACLLSSNSLFSKPGLLKTNEPIKKVMLVVAEEDEAKPLIAALNLSKVNPALSDLPMQEYKGTYKKLEIYLIANGTDPINHVQNVGTQPSTLSTYVGIDHFHPDLIISVGTAGGVPERDPQINDVYISTKIYFYDRRMQSPGYHEYGLGGYPSLALSSISKNLGLKEGIVCSGNSFDENEVDYKIILEQNCSAIEMEAAGVAWVSMLTHTPMIALKGITNPIKGDDVFEQYRKNLAMVNETITTKLTQLLSEINQ